MPPASRTSKTRLRYTGPGAWILRTDAKKEYGIGDADLKALVPFSVETNPNNDVQTMTKYKRTDVRRLVRALENGEGLVLPTRKGWGDIIRSDAIEQYKVTSKRLDAALKFKKQFKNKYGGISTIFWLADVKALAQQGENLRQLWAAQTPSPSQSGPATSSRRGIDESRLRTGRWLGPEEFEIWLDSRSHEESAFLMNRALHP